MGIRQLLKSITDHFNKNELEFAVIGAYALYAYGYTRATRDIDFLTRNEDRAGIIKYLESLGFETIHASDAFSNHVHPIGDTRVDILYVDNVTGDIIFDKCEDLLVLDELSLPVVSKEHLVRLKLFAAKSNPERRLRDLADIKEIVMRTDIDPQKVKALCAEYGLDKYIQEIIGDE